MSKEQISSRSYPLNIAGLEQPLRMWVHADGVDGHVSKRIREEGVWETYETQLLIEALQSRSQDNYRMIDVGANLGYYSLVAASLLGNSGTVYAFEPEPTNFAILSKNISENRLDNIIARHAGLSDVSAAGNLYLNPENRGDHQMYNAKNDRQSTPISLLNGDEFFADVARVDFIKIDTQGAEYHVLSGLDALIRRSLPALKLIVEFWPFGLRKAGHSGEALLDLLLSYELPMNLIDHIGHGLIPCTEKDIRDWIQQTDADPANEGFINLLLG